MTDNEIRREKTFNEELPHFKERIQQVFDNYDNPNGSEDPLYICVLRDSKRVVRKAEEEIIRQQAEIEKLRKEIQNIPFCRYYPEPDIVKDDCVHKEQITIRAKQHLKYLEYNKDEKE